MTQTLSSLLTFDEQVFVSFPSVASTNIGHPLVAKVTHRCPPANLRAHCSFIQSAFCLLGGRSATANPCSQLLLRRAQTHPLYTETHQVQVQQVQLGLMFRVHL